MKSPRKSRSQARRAGGILRAQTLLLATGAIALLAGIGCGSGGMLAQPESTDTSQLYKNAPYNTYSKWVHDTCPGIYAFPCDDYPSGAGESGLRACKADRLDVTFCPGG